MVAGGSLFGATPLAKQQVATYIMAMAPKVFHPSRRAFLATLPSLGLLAACAAESAPSEPGAVAFAADAWRELDENAWRARLSDQAFRVLRREATERPFTSPLNAEKRTGTYVCAGCELPLFSSETKYDSGTGWPSFYDVLPGAIGTKPDHKLWVTRTEYHCARCLGHQGHVFEDGPAPTGLRYCNNGVALTFVPDQV
jgi:peptide-methionine (R)-S-oxide reductase